MEAPSSRSALIVGIAARMRESSTTLPSESGTLKSTRKRTRWPRASSSRIVRFPVADSNDVAIRRGPIPSGRGRGTKRTAGRGASVEVLDFDEGFACRFAGRLGPPMDAPDACVAPFGGSGTPGFTCGRFAGRLGAIFGAPRFTPGFPADGFGATSVDLATVGAPFAAGFAVALAIGLAGVGLTDDVLTGAFTGAFAAGFGAGFLTAGFFSADFFSVGFFSVGAAKIRERRPFFSATGSHELHKIRNTAAVAPLVVIPGDHLGEVVAEQHGACGINDCGARVTTEVG